MCSGHFQGVQGIFRSRLVRMREYYIRFQLLSDRLLSDRMFRIIIFLPFLSVGEPGLPGVDGRTGDSGPVGEQGSQGDPGVKGEIHVIGLQHQHD